MDSAKIFFSIYNVGHYCRGALYL